MSVIVAAVALGCGSGDQVARYVSVRVYHGPPLSVSTSAGGGRVVQCGTTVTLTPPAGYEQSWDVTISAPGVQLAHVVVPAQPTARDSRGQIVTTGSPGALIVYGYAVDRNLPSDTSGSDLGSTGC